MQPILNVVKQHLEKKLREVQTRFSVEKCIYYFFLSEMMIAKTQMLLS